MARANFVQNAFTSGEVSKQFQSRSDHQKYPAALRESRNGLILAQGPVTRRPGFRYVASTKFADKFARLLPFQFNVTQTYALEFGDQYIRFFTDEAQLLDDVTGKGFTNGDFTTNLDGWTDADVGTGASTQSAGKMLLTGGAATDYARRYQQLVSGLGVGTYTVTLDVGVAGVTYEVGTTGGGTNLATGNLTTGVGKTFTFTLTSQSDVFVGFRNQNASTAPTVDNVVLSISTPRVYEINSPYTEAQLRAIKFTQSADILYLVHPSHKPKQLNRLGASRWTITDLDFKDGPFNTINVDASKTLTTSAAGALGTAVTVTATGHAPFTAAMVGSLIRHKRVGQWRSIKITAFTSSTSVDGVFQDDNPTGYTAGAASDWRMGTWSDVNGWPSVTTFFQQRLMFANNAAFPQKIWGSISGIFDKYSPSNADGTVTDDRGIDYLIASDQVNSIVWLSPGKVISIGTIEGEWILRAGTLSNPEALSPTNAVATRETTIGSNENLRVNRPGANVTIFIDRATRKVYEYLFDYNIDGFAAPELTLLSRHITKSGVVDSTFADEVQWFVLGNGGLVSMTYLRAEQVVGWAEHPIGGSFGDGPPVMESITSITAPDLSHEQVWGIFKRTIDGNTVKYVEFMEELFDPDDPDDKSDAFFVDCGLTYNGAPTTTITGLAHLEGEEVAVLADGAPIPNKTVTGGQIQLGSNNASSVVQVGLPTYWQVKTLDPDVGGDAGTARGKTKRCENVKVKFIDTLGCKVGRDEDNLDDIVFREPDDVMGESPPLFTGYKEVAFEDDYVDDLQIVLRNDQPLPITVGEILMDLTVHEQ